MAALHGAAAHGGEGIVARYHADQSGALLHANATR